MNFKVENIEVAFLERSIKRSGLPMSTDDSFISECINDNDLKRARNLASVDSGTGHDCFLKGIQIACDITAPQYWWPQFQRYHFSDIVSSQSKMHRLTACRGADKYNEYVFEEVKCAIDEMIRCYNMDVKYPIDLAYFSEKFVVANKHDLFMRILSNLPCGFMLTSAVTMNYLQLKTIFQQRKNHKLDEWGVFLDAFKANLPMPELVFGENK